MCLCVCIGNEHRLLSLRSATTRGQWHIPCLFSSVQNYLDADMRSRADIMRREVTALEKAFSCIRSVAANKVARAQGKGGASRLDRLLIVGCAIVHSNLCGSLLL